VPLEVSDGWLDIRYLNIDSPSCVKRFGGHGLIQVIVKALWMEELVERRHVRNEKG
jgi:hypothetical protein